MPLTNKEICEAISADWKTRRITHQIAADQIGTTKQTISNQLTGKRRFSQNMAKKFSDAFGYSLSWLLFGEGNMFKEGHMHYVVDHDEHTLYLAGNFENILKESRKIRVAERLLEILNNKVAISAYHAYLDENYEEYEKLRDMLENDYGYDLPHFSNDPKRLAAYRQIRQFFTEAETEAAKELVILEHRAAEGEVIAIDAEIERFRNKLEKLKRAYKQ